MRYCWDFLIGIKTELWNTCKVALNTWHGLLLERPAELWAASGKLYSSRFLFPYFSVSSAVGLFCVCRVASAGCACVRICVGAFVRACGVSYNFGRFLWRVLFLFCFFSFSFLFFTKQYLPSKFIREHMDWTVEKKTVLACLLLEV